VCTGGVRAAGRDRAGAHAGASKTGVMAPIDTTYTDRLSRYAAGVRYEHLPTERLHEPVRRLEELPDIAELVSRLAADA
jgi:hypothetical protein